MGAGRPKGSKNKGPRVAKKDADMAKIGSGHSDIESAKAYETRIKVLEMRKAGFDFLYISQNLLGAKTEAAARMIFKTALAELKKESIETAEETRSLELLRLDDLYLKAYRKVCTGTDAVAAKYIEICLKIMERRAKLLGLDSKEQMELLGKPVVINLACKPMDTGRDKIEFMEMDDGK